MKAEERALSYYTLFFSSKLNFSLDVFHLFPRKILRSIVYIHYIIMSLFLVQNHHIFIA